MNLLEMGIHSIKGYTQIVELLLKRKDANMNIKDVKFPNLMFRFMFLMLYFFI